MYAMFVQWGGVNWKKEKKNENQYSDDNALECARHVGCQHRRIRRVDTFCFLAPCQPSQLTCSVFLFYFRLFCFLPDTPRAATPITIPVFHPCRRNERASRTSPHFVLITSHRQDARIVGFPRDTWRSF